VTREFIPLKGKQLLLVEKLEADIERLNDLLWEEAGNRVEIERLRAAVQPAAQSVLDEFVEDLTSQQRSYIVDQIARRALVGKEG